MDAVVPVAVRYTLQGLPDYLFREELWAALGTIQSRDDIGGANIPAAILFN